MARLVLVARAWGVRPSSFVSGLSGLEAFLLDEAAADFLRRLEAGEMPGRPGEPSNVL